MIDSVWNLLRSAVIGIGQPPQAFALSAEIDGAYVQTTRLISIDDKPAGVIVVATVALPDWDLPEGKVTVPITERKQCERALEAVAHLLSVDRLTSHFVSSVQPYLGFDCDDESLLASAEGRSVEIDLIRPVVGGNSGTAMLETVEPAVLSDRLDGVALLAEALNQRTGLGEYLQLIRLFERAFRLAPFGLTEPLASFLASGAHGFSLDEVSQWTDARPSAVHADRREEFLLTADVRPFVSRMREAGYDVLLNKADWRSKSPTRRDAWRPASGSTTPDGGVFITQGRDASIAAQFFDGCSAYPLMLAGPCEVVLPRAAWVCQGQLGAQLRVRGEWAATNPIGSPQP
jgi:hypothetical protein